MVNLAITILPVFLTFAVAAWHKPTAEIQPRSAEASCRNCNA
jgi:hypothetical protein